MIQGVECVVVQPPAGFSNPCSSCPEYIHGEGKCSIKGEGYANSCMTSLSTAVWMPVKDYALLRLQGKL